MRKIMIMIGIAIIFFALSGCNGYKNQRELAVDKNWARSFETARFTQIVNPDAGNIAVEDQGMNGIAVQHNHDKYQKDFKKQDAPSQVFNINLGNQIKK
ncbi:MAG: hypothetical protein ABFR31_10065 [Thermodesulfobacteriota bacterium]